MYKLSYYRFDEILTSYSNPKGWDNLRKQEIGRKGYKLKNFEEAFTSENWMIRIFKVKEYGNRDDI